MKSGFTAKWGKNFGKEKESKNSVKNMMKFSFGSTILLRGIWTSYVMYSAKGMKNCLKSILSIFKSIIRSKNLDMFGKLCFNHFYKVTIDL